MRKLNVFGLSVLMFCLLMAGGCAKKVNSLPEASNVSGSSVDDSCNTGTEVASDDMYRSAIERIAADKIYFAFDSNELSQESRQILTEKADLLKANPALSLVIEGHCDERGTNEYNMALGERRARAAYDYLVMMGVDAARISVLSYGEEYPAVQGSNEAAWAKNRRDEFRASSN